MKADSRDPYADIRPYEDFEVAAVIERLLNTRELIDALVHFRFPGSSRWAGWLLRPLVRQVLARQLRGVDSIAAMQDVVARYMQRMIDHTTDHLSYSGLEHLRPEGAYLFISNHRDIAMDPAFVNWGLYQQGLKTVRIAIGDNLLRKPYVSDLMRLNKSFIVKRSARGMREKMAALMQLSAYIHDSIDSGHSVWIAQREGRAKDGDDRTDPAMLKMLHACRKKEEHFAESIERLHIVPVAISYEYDPCDQAKARELSALETRGNYEKSRFEDIDSIARGITGYKGSIHLAFAPPLEATYASPEALAEAIDAEIHANYRLHPSNLLASGESASGLPVDKAREYQRRLENLSPEGQRWFNRMYANPVLNQKRLKEGA